MDKPKNEQVLNMKLALWAGFKTVRGRYYGINAPNGEYVAIPNFTQSLDTCFKWLVPKLEGCLITTDTDKFRAEVSIHGTFYEYDKNPALALCLALESLIDWRKT